MKNEINHGQYREFKVSYVPKTCVICVFKKTKTYAVLRYLFRIIFYLCSFEIYKSPPEIKYQFHFSKIHIYSRDSTWKKEDYPRSIDKSFSPYFISFHIDFAFIRFL